VGRDKAGRRSDATGLHAPTSASLRRDHRHVGLHHDECGLPVSGALEKVSSGEGFAAQAGEVLFRFVGGRVFAAVVIVAILGSLASLVLSSPRVYFAMARDGLFIPSIAVLDSRFGTPARAIALQATLASLLAILGTFNEIVSYFVFVVVIFIGLSVAALFVIRRLNQHILSLLTLIIIYIYNILSYYLLQTFLPIHSLPYTPLIPHTSTLTIN
jgi:amino acid transporter